MRSIEIYNFEVYTRNTKIICICRKKVCARLSIVKQMQKHYKFINPKTSNRLNKKKVW